LQIEVSWLSSGKLLLLFLFLGFLKFVSSNALDRTLLLLASRVGSLLSLLVPVKMVASTVEIALWKSEDLQSGEQEVEWTLHVAHDIIVIDLMF